MTSFYVFFLPESITWISLHFKTKITQLTPTDNKTALHIIVYDYIISLVFEIYILKHFRVPYPLGGGRTIWSRMVGLPPLPRTLVLSCCPPCSAWQRWVRWSGLRPFTDWAPGRVWLPVTWCPSRSSPYTYTQKWRYWYRVTSWWVPGWDAGRRLEPQCSWRSHLKWRTCCPTGRSVNLRAMADGRQLPGIWPGDSR